MKQVVLQFPSLQELKDFKQVTRTEPLVVDWLNFKLTALLSEADQELAQNGYNATVLFIHKV